MRISTARFAALLVLALSTRTPGLHAQQPASPAKRTTASDTAYSSNASDFTLGKHVYLRSTKTLIGTIAAVDQNRSFPRGFPRPHMQAVLIARADNRKDWVPVEGITRIYVTR